MLLILGATSSLSDLFCSFVSAFLHPSVHIPSGLLLIIILNFYLSNCLISGIS